MRGLGDSRFWLAAACAAALTAPPSAPAQAPPVRLPARALLSAAPTPDQLGVPRFEPPAPGSYELPPLGRVRERTLRDSSGANAPLLGLAPGEAAVVSFIYLSCPHACPMASASMQRLDRMLAGRAELAGRVQLVSVSFDPERDTPKNMRRLERQLAPRGRWRFLTPPGVEPLRALLADFGQDALSVARTRQLRHVLKIFLVDDHGAIRNVYSTGLLDPRLILNDLLTLQAEAGS